MSETAEWLDNLRDVPFCPKEESPHKHQIIGGRDFCIADDNHSAECWLDKHTECDRVQICPCTCHHPFVLSPVLAEMAQALGLEVLGVADESDTPVNQ